MSGYDDDLDFGQRCSSREDCSLNTKPGKVVVNKKNTEPPNEKETRNGFDDDLDTGKNVVVSISTTTDSKRKSDNKLKVQRKLNIEKKRKRNEGSLLKRILITLILNAGFVSIVVGLMLEFDYVDDVYCVVSIIQSILMIFWDVYYTKLVWKGDSSGEKLLLLPILHKFKIYDSITDVKQLRTRLFYRVGTLIFVTIVIDAIVAIGVNSWFESPVCSILLSVTTLIWLIFYIFAKAEPWLNPNEPKQ